MISMLRNLDQGIRRRLVVLVATVFVLAGSTMGVSYAQPLESDPTCVWLYASNPTLRYRREFNQYAEIPFAREVGLTGLRLVQGDREFKGHGPYVEARVNVQVASDGIYAYVYMYARETKSNWSTGVAYRKLIFLQLKDDWRIVKVAPETFSSRGQPQPDHARIYNLARAGGSYLGPARVIRYTDTDHEDDIFLEYTHRFISQYRIVGDTKGDDIKPGRTGIYVRTDIGAICVAPSN